MTTFPLTIAQVSGASPKSITLDATTLPEKRLVESVAVDLVRTDYVGNPVPSVQVLNSKTAPMKLEGLFSDRETGVEGYADAARDALLAIEADGLPVRLTWRTVDVMGIISKLDLSHGDGTEIAYKMEIEVTQYAGARDAAAAAAAFQSKEALRNQLDTLVTAYEDLPPEIRVPPPNTIVTDIDLDYPVRIPPPEFILDPWLEFRLLVEEIHARARFLLERIGNQALLDADDTAIVAARAAWIATNKARAAIDAWQGGGLDLATFLSDAANVAALASVLDSLSLSFGDLL
jgi:hypothetical protein